MFSAKVGSHSGQNVSSLPEATQQNSKEQEFLTCPSGEQWNKESRHAGRGRTCKRHTDPLSQSSGATMSHHVNKCIIFIIYCSPGLSSWIDALSSGLLGWQRASRDQNVQPLTGSEPGWTGSSMATSEGQPAHVRCCGDEAGEARLRWRGHV